MRKRPDIKTLICLCLGVLIFLFSGCRQKQSASVTLIFTNDIHGVYKPYQLDYFGDSRLVGGMEALSHYVKQLRAEEENVILIDTGDVMTGTLASQKTYNGVTGGAMVEFLNMLNYDIRCPGNHGFDLGTENATSSIELSDFPVIMSNLIYKETKELVTPSAYHIIKKGGIRFGFIAVMEEDFFEEVKREMTGDLELLPIIPTLNSTISRIKSSTDVIVVLSHARFPVGEKIARQVPGVDVVLVAAEDGKFENSDGVLIKSTIGHLRTVGYLKLEFKDSSIKNYQEDLIWLWADVDLDPDLEVSELVRKIDSVINEEYLQNCGRALRDMIQEGRNVENPIGNWITDVLRWKTGAQIGLYNSRGIRSSIRAGGITGKDIFEVAPFYNELVLFRITAEQLKNAFEKDIERGRDRLQVSGLRYEYFPPDQRPLGQRVWMVEVDGEIIVNKGKLLNPERTFTAVSNDYVVSQAEGKYIGSPIDAVRKTGWAINQVLISWLRTYHTLDYTTENRIVRLDPRGDL
ncbi:MAG: hypothetical protein GF421_07090 [Candidatus Aminicenantes bacterium]|nr:hypothetical protein [Candidatus Aminicenantes bacterium]